MRDTYYEFPYFQVKMSYLIPPIHKLKAGHMDSFFRL